MNISHILSKFSKPLKHNVKIHSVDYRYLLPETVNLFNYNKKYRHNDVSYDLYGYVEDTLIDIYPTYKNIITKNDLPASWITYINLIKDVTGVKKISVLIYNKKYKKYTNVLDLSDRENIAIRCECQNGSSLNLANLTCSVCLQPSGDKKVNHEVSEKWIKATGLKNYMMDDTILDIIYKQEKNDNTVRCQSQDPQRGSDFVSTNATSQMTPEVKPPLKEGVLTSAIDGILKVKQMIEEPEQLMIERLCMGNDFERDIIDELIKNYYLHFVKICESYEAKNIEKYKYTLSEMKKQTPIIHQAVLHDPVSKVYGCVDLLIRSDWLNKIFVNCADLTINNNNNHYVVIDIKFHRLQYNSDGKTLRNEGMMKVFKSQIYIYNKALGAMQNYTPSEAYILGRGWVKSNIEKGIVITEKNKNPFDKLGIIDFNKVDKDIASKSDDGIKWLNELHEHKYDDTCRKYNHCYPNMNNSIE